MTDLQAGNTAPASPTNVAFFRGRVISFRSYEKADGAHRVVTALRLPAADEYSSAGAVEIDGPESLGKAGDVVSVKVAVGGSLRPFKWTDKDSGEVKRGTEARVTFRFLASA